VATTGARGLGEGHHFAGGIYPYFTAGFAVLVVYFFLGFLVQGPAFVQHLGLGHQQAQVGVGAQINIAATVAMPTGTLLAALQT
jgi:hypothetical protein